MKILIIATPRSGSTTLINIVAKMLGYIKYYEPYNYWHPGLASQNYPKVLPKDVVVKTMYSQIPLDLDIESKEFYLQEIKKFDKIILLSRLDIKASYESFNYRLKFTPKGNWHTKYTYNETERNIDVYSSFLTWTNDLIEFSKEISTPVTWYEDIYDVNDRKVVEDWDLNLDIDIFYKYINLRPRYRKIDKTIFII
jgi:hypothetical protein